MFREFLNLKNIFINSIILTVVMFSQSGYTEGLYLEFENLIKNQKTKYRDLTNNLVNRDFDLSDVSSLETVSLDKTYLNILIQNTPARYMLFANNDRCSIYDLMNTDLLRTPGGKLEQVVFTYTDKKNALQRRLLPKEKFLRIIAYKQCPKVKIFKQHFSLKNVRKTISKIHLKTPKSEDECIDNLENFRKDLKSPYLCQMIEKIRGIKVKQIQFNNLSKTNYKMRNKLKKELVVANSLKKVLSKQAKDILEGHCLSLNNPMRYCAIYFKQSFWTRTQKENPKSAVLSSYCFKKKRGECIRELNKNPYYCHFSSPQYQGLNPKPNCNDLSRALLKSRIYSNYNDCPIKTGNEAVTTFSRVLNHFEDYLPENLKSCELNSVFPFVKLNEELTDFQSWQIQLCFINKLDGNKKVCHPTMFKNVKGSKLSLSHVVKKIASRLKGYDGGECRIITEKEFRPNLLEYRSGCHIIQEDKNCTGVNCNFKVMLGETEFKNFFIESNLEFNLFAVDFINENKSLLKIYIKGKKKSLKIIKNVSSFLSVFSLHKKSIFLGVGCAEELLPSFFTRSYLNQCSPLPFVVDGFLEKNKSYSMITRTSLDQINAPRIIPWSNIFASIRGLQSLHPTKAWGFYAIY